MSKEKSRFEISWLGLDGFLVVLYFALVGIIFYAIIYHNDLIIGRLVPYGIMIAVTLIFINYLSIVLKFAKRKSGASEDSQKE